MTSIGKEIRLKRISEDNKFICVPMDHGFANGPIKGLDCFYNTVKKVIDGNATSIIVHTGMVRYLPPLKNTGLILHVTGNNRKNEVIISNVVQCITFGADAISFQINIYNDLSQNLICGLETIISDCNKYSMPVLAMLYIYNENDELSYEPRAYINAIRMLTELGVDIVKIPYFSSTQQMESIIQSSLIPVLIAGGNFVEDSMLFEMIDNISNANASGICIGRNLFQSSDSTNRLLGIRYKFGLK